jgi:mRNA interferase HigB
MRVIGTKVLEDCAKKHADVRKQLNAWREDVQRAIWTEPAQIKATYAAASILPGNRVVFNIKGRDYRMVVKVDYERGYVQIRFAGTHEEYTRINAAAI